jgi:hypothetical protein
MVIHHLTGRGLMESQMTQIDKLHIGFVISGGSDAKRVPLIK